MLTHNHNLASGDKVLVEEQLLGKTATFQYTQTGIVGTTAKIEVYITTNKRTMPWVLVPESTLTIDPAKPSDYIVLVGFGYVYVRLKLVAGGATGVLNTTEFNKG